GLFRLSEEKVSEGLLRREVSRRRGACGRCSGKNKRTACIGGVTQVCELMAEICAPCPAMLTMSQAHGVAERIVLVGAELRCQVLQVEQRSKVQNRQPKILRRLGDSRDSQLSFDIVGVGEVVGGLNIAPVVTEAQRIQKHAFDCRVAEAYVVIVNTLTSAQAGERVEHRAANVVVNQSAVDALRPVRLLFFLVAVL